MLILWGRPNSSNVKKVLWTLEELGLEFEHIKIGGTYGGLHESAYLALNPNGLVPTLRDDELVIWESNCIVRYLAAAYGMENLWNEDSKIRAKSEKWMDWGAAKLFPPFHDMLFHTLRLPEDQRSPAIAARGVEDFEKALTIMEAELALAPWLSGENFGIADIVPGVFVYYYYAMEVERKAHFSHVERWYQKLQLRAAYVSTVMIAID